MKKKTLLFVLLFSSIFYGQFTENFESYPLGRLNENPTLWNTWSGDYDITQSIIIDNTYANTGSNSAKIVNYVDAILNLGNKSSSKWQLNFKMYIPSGKSAFFNVQENLTAQGGTQQSGESFITSFNFNKDNLNQGIAEIAANPSNPTIVSFAFPHDSWFDVELLFNLDNKSFRMKINNVVVNTIARPFAYPTNTILGGIDFFGFTATDECWIDDITFVENTSIPDTNLITDLGFEQRLIDLGIDTDGLSGEILIADYGSITSLDVSNINASSLRGIEGFVSLTNLNASQNNLSTIDISDLTQLQNLNLVDNDLFFIDLSNNNLLSNINLSSNKLTGVLDLSLKPNLVSLNINNNKFSALNLTNSNNTSLSSFSALNCVNLNCLQVDDVTFANNQVTNNLWFKDASASFSVNCNIQTHLVITDPNFEQELVNLGIDSNGLSGDILINEPLVVTDLYLSNKSISNISGIEGFLNLKTLDISQNSIAALDVSSLLDLEILNANQNNIASIDVSNNTSLISLFLDQNKVTTFSVSNPLPLRNLYLNNQQVGFKLNALNVLQLSDLEVLNANQNDIMSLDISNNNALKNLSLQQNKITSFSVVNQPVLTILYLTNQQVGFKLNSLNVVNAPALTDLRFASNELTTIDLSNNNALSTLDAKINLLSGTVDLSAKTNLSQLAIRNNNLNGLNVKNGFNTNISLFSINNNPNLVCTEVDDAVFANDKVTNGLWFKDTTTTFSTDCVAFLSTDSFEKQKLVIYPNPVKDILTIQNINNEEIYNIEIYSTTGKLVKQADKNNDYINVEDLALGFYIVKIYTSNGTVNEKIVKQ